MTIEESDPSQVVAMKIMYVSDYFRDLGSEMDELKEQVANEKDVTSRAKLTTQLQLKIARMAKTYQVAVFIYNTFRSIPYLSDRLKKAKKYFYKGEFLKMDEILDADAARIDAKYEKDPVILQTISYEMVVKGLFHRSLSDNTVAEESLRRYLSFAFKTSQNVHTTFEWATFLMMHAKKHDQAFPLFDIAYTLAETLDDEYRRFYQAQCLCSKSEIEKSKHNTEQAILFASQALNLYTELAEQNPAEYASRKIDLLTIIGDYHMSDNRPDIAVVVYEEAAKLRRPLVLTDDHDSSASLVALLDKQAIAHSAIGEYQTAFDLFEESLRLQKASAFSDDNDTMFGTRADTLSNMADTYMAVKDYEEALRCAKEAFELYKKGGDMKPSELLPGSLRLVGKISRLYSLLGDTDTAFDYLSVSLKFFSGLDQEMWKEEQLSKAMADNTYELAFIYYKDKSYDNYFSTLGMVIEAYNCLASIYRDEKKYCIKLGVLFRDVALYHQKISGKLKPMIFAAKRAFEFLDKENRNAEAEQAYQDVLQIRKEYPELPQQNTNKKKKPHTR